MEPAVITHREPKKKTVLSRSAAFAKYVLLYLTFCTKYSWFHEIKFNHEQKQKKYKIVPI